MTAQPDRACPRPESWYPMENGIPSFGDGVHVVQCRYDYSDAALDVLKRSMSLPERLHAAGGRRQID